MFHIAEEKTLIPCKNRNIRVPYNINIFNIWSWEYQNTLNLFSPFLTEGRSVCHWPYLLWFKWKIKSTISNTGRFTRAVFRTTNQVRPFRNETVCTFSWSGNALCFICNPCDKTLWFNTLLCVSCLRFSSCTYHVRPSTKPTKYCFKCFCFRLLLLREWTVLAKNWLWTKSVQ